MGRRNRDIARARNASYRPLKITAWLRCGIVGDPLQPIDGILYYAIHRRDRRGDGRLMSRPKASAVECGADDPHLRLPLKIRAGDTRDWYYAASGAIWPPHVADGTDYWVKRVDVAQAHFAAVTAKVPISGGRYRGYRMPIPYRHALSVSWYVVGDPEEIRQLLSLVTHVGKKTEMGWGAVIRWEVEPTDDDYSERDAAGQPTRPLPDQAGILYGIRPPYWHPRNQTLCVLPPTRTEAGHP